MGLRPTPRQGRTPPGLRPGPRTRGQPLVAPIGLPPDMRWPGGGRPASRPTPIGPAGDTFGASAVPTRRRQAEPAAAAGQGRFRTDPVGATGRSPGDRQVARRSGVVAHGAGSRLDVPVRHPWAGDGDEKRGRARAPATSAPDGLGRCRWRRSPGVPGLARGGPGSYRLAGRQICASGMPSPSTSPSTYSVVTRWLMSWASEATEKRAPLSRSRAIHWTYASLNASLYSGL